MKDLNIPNEVKLSGHNLEVRLMAAADLDLITSFASDLPRHDLLFLRRDITNPKVLAAWLKAIEHGTSAATVLAVNNGKVAGCGAVIHDPFSWSPHLGEIRVLTLPDYRGFGLGRFLIEQCIRVAIARGLSKLTAQMTVDQTGAIAVFEEMGFVGEALLKEHVVDTENQHHDIVVLSCNVNKTLGQLSALN